MNKQNMFVQMVEEHKQDYYRLAYSYVRNQADALDIVSESIKKGLLSINKLENVDALRSWFYKIIVRTSLDFLKKHKRMTVSDHDKITYLQRGEQDVYMHFDLHDALAQLPLQYKTVILLRYFEDLKIQEIATVIDENVNTVKTRLYRGLKLLKLELTEGDEMDE